MHYGLKQKMLNKMNFFIWGTLLQAQKAGVERFIFKDVDSYTEQLKDSNRSITKYLIRMMLLQSLKIANLRKLKGRNKSYMLGKKNFYQIHFRIYQSRHNQNYDSNELSQQFDQLSFNSLNSTKGNSKRLNKRSFYNPKQKYTSSFNGLKTVKFQKENITFYILIVIMIKSGPTKQNSQRFGKIHL
ncbi:hypothetical protein pb186bvf_010531 [Paramecium bursaria]